MNNPLKYTDPSGYQYFRNYDELPFMDSGAGYAAGSAFYRADMISNYGYSAATAMMPHWSVSTRNPGTNHAHMNRRTYDGIYGKGAYDVYYDDFYVSKEVDISTTGNVAEKDFGTVLAWMQEGFSLTIINNTVIGHFGDFGEVRMYADGSIKVMNATVGAVSGEALATASIGKGNWGISLDFLISFGLPKMRNGFSLAFIKAKNDFGFSFTLYGNGDGYEIAGSVNYLNIYSTNEKNLSIQETFGPGQTWSYGLHIANYSRSGNGNINTQTASSYAIDAYGLSFGAPIASSHYQTYTWGITWSQIINYLYK